MWKKKKSINHSQHFSNYPLFRFNLSKLEPWCKNKSESCFIILGLLAPCNFQHNQIQVEFPALAVGFHCRQGQVCTQMTTGNMSVTSSNHLLLRLTQATASDGLGFVSPTDCRYIRIWLMFIRQLRSALERHHNFQGCFIQILVWIQFCLKSARKNILVGTAICSMGSTAEPQHSAGCGRKH